jgi:hypothetical protein
MPIHATADNVETNRVVDRDLGTMPALPAARDDA